MEALESAKFISEERNRYVHAGYTTFMRDHNTIEVIVHQRLRDFAKENLYDVENESLRVCPGTSSRIAKLSEHESD